MRFTERGRYTPLSGLWGFLLFTLSYTSLCIFIGQTSTVDLFLQISCITVITIFISGAPVLPVYGMYLGLHEVPTADAADDILRRILFFVDVNVLPCAPLRKGRND